MATIYVNNVRDIDNTQMPRTYFGGTSSNTQMTAWLNALPTDPPVGGGWWNNSGIATYAAS